MKKGSSYIFFILFWMLVLSGCSMTKYVPEGKYILNKVSIDFENRKEKVPALKKYIQQKPNTKVLGLFRVQLGFYNISGRKDKRINRWFRKIGEAPVVYDSLMTDRSIERLESYLNNKGYYDARITDSLTTKKDKVNLRYRVSPGERTMVTDLDFNDRDRVAEAPAARDSVMNSLRLQDTSSSCLYEGMPLDVEILEKERTRIAESYRNNGYYAFSPNYVRFVADTISRNRYNSKEAKLVTTVSIPKVDSTAAVNYSIGDISVIMDFDQTMFLKGDTLKYKELVYENILFKYYTHLYLKPKVIHQCISFKTGDRYGTAPVATVYSRLQALGVFKYVNIVFKERPGGKLDCEIQLTPMKKQSYTAFVEGTNNSGNIGVGGNLTYSHRNLFKGAENFSLKAWGALKKERMKENKFFSTTEFGVEAKLETPQFWMPFIKMKEFRRNSAPHTIVSFSYNDENTRYYRRAVSTFKYGYWWKTQTNWRVDFNIADINYVNMRNVDGNFFNSLRNDYIKSAYTSHVVSSGNASITYSGAKADKESSYNWAKWSLESAGNLKYGIDELFNISNAGSGDDRYHDFFGVRYSQYVKFDVDYRFLHHVNEYNSFVYRVFAGVAYPYGNMKVMPFEEAYFVGGANDLRGWHSRTLGPGSNVSEDNYPNSVGDFKIEANWEYRFKLFWLLEGAIFLDAGNVWKLTKTENLPGALLSKNFYREIAVDCGPGIRLDVNFFLLRLDWGIKMRDPSKTPGNRFVLVNNGKWMKNTVFNIAIGYPF